MHRKKILVGGFILALGLAACGEQNSSARGVYNCEGGVVLDITFKDGKTVDIKSNSGGDYALTRVESATGAKYENEGSIFISKGVTALFIADVGIKPVNCRRR